MAPFVEIFIHEVLEIFILHESIYDLIGDPRLSPDWRLEIVAKFFSPNLTMFVSFA
ncbi:MAG: hypothetical protein IPG02_00160 [Ignavibacteria bacterium]|nr:hypothetical protein [Ignavibacteria bacterium]